MDDVTRAELGELRRRAFGPDPDIAADLAAIHRLVALESLVLTEHAALYAARHPVVTAIDDDVHAGEGDGEGAVVAAYLLTRTTSRDDSGFAGEAPVADSPAESEADADPVRPRSRRVRRRDGAGLALGAALAAVIVVAASAAGPPAASSATMAIETTREAFSLTRDSDATVLLRVPIERGFPVGLDVPDEQVPPFPSSGKVEWASRLGDYYGWTLWIAGASGVLQDEHCILVIRGSVAKGRCVVAALRGQSALTVSVPYTVVEPDERPPGLVPGWRIGFWWSDEPVVRVLLASVPVER